MLIGTWARLQRFLNVPRATMEKELKLEEKGMAEDLTALNKKSKFLEKQYQDANSQLRDIVCLYMIFDSLFLALILILLATHSFIVPNLDHDHSS